MRNYCIKNTVWNTKGKELDGIAHQMLKEENIYYVCGNKKELKDFDKRMGAQIIIKRFILTDSNDEELFHIPVSLESEVLANRNTVIICTSRDRMQYETLREIWDKKGFVENNAFFQAEVFEMVYYTYKRNQIRLDRIEIFLTSYCTLNCEKCISYIPYFKNQVHTSLQQLKEDADLLFSKIDYLHKIKLLGGEGFLYPYIIEYVDYLYDNYGGKIGSIRIGTNGTIFPKQEILDMCKRDDVTVDISDYTSAVPEKCKLKEVEKLCRDNGISVDIKRTGEQWLDMGFPNNLPEEKTEEELREHFSKCAMFCRQFNQSKLYYCCSNFAAVRTGLFKENENNYFDFNKEFSKKELLEYELGYSGLGHTTFCGVCRGCSEEANPYHVDVAKQIDRDGNLQIRVGVKNSEDI